MVMNGGVVAYCSRQQTTPALCIAMAEMIATVTVKVKHFRNIPFDLIFRQAESTHINSTIVWVDNTAALAVANEMSTRSLRIMTKQL